MTDAISKQITIVTACRNREDNLRQAIQSWLTLSPCKIIICDWGSAIPLTHEYLEIGECKKLVDIIRYEASQWVLTWAFNEALAKVESAYTLKLDCDHVVTSRFVELNRPCYGHFSRGHWRHAEEGQQYINGAFLSCTDLLRRVGYYDERITTYGWDDSDLYTRLYDAGLGSSVLAKRSLRHLEQCETTRTKEQELSKEGALASSLGIEKTEFLITRNRILCGMLWPWDSNTFKNRDKIKARFFAPEPEEEALIEYSTLKAFEMHYQLKGLFDKTGIPAGEAYSEALYALDQSTFNAPSALSIAKLIRRYSDAIRKGDDCDKSLARMAMLANSRESRLRSRLEAIDRVDAIHATSHPENQNKISKNFLISGILIKRGTFFIDAQHGLGNRLRAIGSAAAIAKATDRELVIVWHPDDHCNCRFADLFDYQGAVINESFHHDAPGCNIYNYMTIEGGRKNEVICGGEKKNIYARSAFTLNSPHSDWASENSFIKTLVPVDAIQALVKSVRYPNDVSVHIRMEGGLRDQHLPYESSANWSKEDHGLIDYWRAKSHFVHFMKRIDALIAQDKVSSIFIAADKPETYEEFRRSYPGHLVWLERSLFDRSSEQLQYALADAILLSKASLLLGSNWSSFTELATRLAAASMRTEMSGVDF